ncbi:MAG: hypothetical protein WC050_03485 [Candidatus Paceibacterota bacterium]
MIINIHMGPRTGGPGESRRRYDTLTTPSGTVATLLHVEETLGLTDIIGVDESFPGETATKQKIGHIIEQDIAEGRRSFLLFTVLLYNAERTVHYVRELKQKYGDKITIVVGGQMVPLAEEAYRNNADIDVVCVGDAEAILPDLVRDMRENMALATHGLKRRYEGWVKDLADQRFAGVSYDRFWMIRERLATQRLISAEFGERNPRGELGFSQLTIQGPGGPGCAWAAGNKDGACSFCALQNITSMSKTPLRDALENEARVAKQFGADRLFDIANQFLPSLKRAEIKRWLTEYIALRGELGMTNNKYVYLTVNSVDDEIAGMLRQIGINEVYLGIDHFHPDALASQNKPFRTSIQNGASVKASQLDSDALEEPVSKDMLERTLSALKANSISFRASVVVGAAHETEETLEAVRRGVREIFTRFENARSIRISSVKIIPGSRIFAEMQESGLCADVFLNFKTLGYLTAKEQDTLNRTYVNELSEISYDQVEAIEREVLEMSREFGKSEYIIEDDRLAMYKTAVAE